MCTEHLLWSLDIKVTLFHLNSLKKREFKVLMKTPPLNVQIKKECAYLSKYVSSPTNQSSDIFSVLVNYVKLCLP